MVVEKTVKYPAVLTILFLVTLLLVSGGCSAVPSGTPAVRLGTTEIDMGTIPNTQPVSRTVTIQNAGGGWLEILGVSTSCGCTTAAVNVSRLPAGGTAQVTITFDPTAHGGEEGPFFRKVYIRTNDPASPEAVISVHVTVVGTGAGQ